MSDYRLNKKVSLSLPWDYDFSKSFDDDGNEIYSIFKGCTVDDEGEESYEFKCTIRETIVEKNTATEGKTLRELWVDAFQHQENVKYLILPGNPDTLMLTLGTGINLFGRVLKLVSLTTMVAVDENSFLTLISSKGYNEENPEDYLPVVENMLTVARSIVINGKGHTLEPVTALSVLEALKPSFDGSAPAEVSIGLEMNVHSNGETAAYEYNTGSADRIMLMKMQPDESLYPHYLSLKDNPASLLGLLGANVVVNGTGTEYEFKSLRKELTVSASDPDSGLSELYRALYQRIVDADHSEYNLDERAREMLPLFRVDSSVFDTKHDRECELAEGYMHRAYMMSALRSFAWTLSDWCRKKNIYPEDLLYGDLQYIISFLSTQEWLNYDADTYCVGLCGCQDLHVYYVPDGVSYSDRQALLPDAEHLAQIEVIRKQFPGFKEIPTRVHSLDALREDLNYILPAIETIYDALAEERNRMEPLSGDAADILYAWCALALAAEGPFFTEDGPTNCWFTQKNDDVLSTEMDKQSKKNNNPRAKRVASDDCTISFSGILEKYEGEDAAIILPEGINAIGSDAFLFNKTLKTVIISDEVETIEADAFWGCEALEEVELPTSLRTICKNAFRSCESLRTIIIPEGVREIEEDAFTGCTNLKDIYLPASLWSIGNDAFCTFNDETVIHAPKGSDAAQYARKHDLKLDHKKPAAAKTKSYNQKSAAVKKTPVKLPECEIRFAEENRVILENGLAVPVPDGYHCCSEGTGVNAGWAYVIPEGVNFNSNHIDTKPYSFAVTVSSGAHITFESKYMEALKKAFLSKGYLAAETPVESLIVSENCGFLYQNWIDDGDATYNKINGFLFAGEDVFQFHIYANHSSGIAHDQKVMDAFLKACREWMQRIRLSAEIIPTKNTVKTTTSKPMDPRQLTHDECEIDRDGVFEGYRGSKTDIILPDTVQRIGGFCKFADTVKTVAIPESVKVIEDYAFYNCTGLQKIIIPDSVTSIGNSAFSGCGGLTEITLPGCITTIEESAFRNCSGLSTIIIPDSVTSIGEWAFCDCTGLKTITISDNITELDSLAFYNCKAISKIIISPGSKRAPNWISNFAESLKEIAIPDSVTEIEEDAFSACKELTQIIIPNGVTTIGKAAFEGCSSLTSVTIPESVISIGESAFSECISLTSVMIPDSVTVLGYGAFEGCSGLRKVAISDSLEDIGFSVFDECPNITTVTILPGSKKVPCIFYGCKSLEEVVLPDGIMRIEDEAFSECTHLASIILPESLLEIGCAAFCGCEALTCLALPEGLTRIEASAFIGCINLEEVKIPDSVTHIGESAFCNCKNLKKITILSNVREIEPDAFDVWVTIFCEKESYAEKYAKDNRIPYQRIGSKSDDRQEIFVIDENGVLQGYNGNDQDVIIPESVTKISLCRSDIIKRVTIPESVSAIENGAFSGCSNLERVILENGIVSIGEKAFANCSRLISIFIPESVTEIGEAAFDSCTELRDIRLPHGIKTVQQSLFSECVNLAEVVIPEGIDTIDDYAFYGCTKLKSIQFPESIVKIGERVFVNCEALSEIVIPGSVRHVGKYAFANCKNLTCVRIGANLDDISDGMFSGCHKLTEITIPETVRSIGYSAFSSCEGIQKIILPMKLRTIGESSFGSCKSLESVVIPAAVLEIGKDAFWNCVKLMDIHLPPFIRDIHNWAFMGISKDAVFHVIKESYPERYCQEKRYQYDHNMDLELLKILQAIVRARKAQAEAKQHTEEEKKLQERRERYRKFVRAIEIQRQIISQNTDMFGSQAQAQKEAQEKLARLQAQMEKEFPNGKL